MKKKTSLYVKFLIVGLLSLTSCASGCKTMKMSEVWSDDPLPRKAFAQIKHSVELEGCGNSPETGEKKCQKATMRYVSSGSFVFHSEVAENVSYVLTAGHSCENKIPPAQMVDGILIKNNGSTFKVVDLEGQHYEAEVVLTNKRFDLCLMKVSDVYKKLPTLKLAKREPNRGEMVTNMAAPHGLFWPGSVLIFKGYFSGYHNRGYSIYTIPTKPGSSGSSIINKDNELVGLIFAGYPVIENVGLSSPLVAIRVFLKKSIALGEMSLWEKNNKPNTGSQINESWLTEMRHSLNKIFDK
jgi:S1-C subfamily serine protease